MSPIALRHGERVALLGPNGAGKTTTLRAMAGLTGATHARSAPRRRVAYVPQDAGASLLPWLDARANIALCGPPDEALRAVPAAADVLARRPGALSGGERQLVALARALATPADVFLFDEPFSALSAQTRAVVRASLRQWLDARGATLVLVTHDLDDVLALVDRAVVLQRARSVADVDLRDDRTRRAEALRAWMRP
ncbi:MAG: ATP-binding cassette domain-containing protein [Polyangiales bacterium]